MKIERLKCNRILLLALGIFIFTCHQISGAEYVVLVGKSVKTDEEWKKVVDRLVQIHEAQVVEYDRFTSETISRLRELMPRYVAVVEKPELIDRQFVVDLNQMSRKVDEDIYSDFLWGIITGYSAEAALELVERAQIPEIVSSAWCLRNEDFRDGKYFERMGLLSGRGIWHEKNGQTDTVVTYSYKDQPEAMIKQMVHWTENNCPELIVYQMEELRNRMPLLEGAEKKEEIILPRNGKLWIGDQQLHTGQQPKVYIAQMSGGQTFGTRESIPLAWLNDGKVTAFIGSVVFSFHGRGEWGTLKYWLTDAGRFTLAEARFLNQQDMLWHLNEWNPELLHENCRYGNNPIEMVSFCYNAYNDFQKKNKETHTEQDYVLDKFGYWYERDIGVYYGDPCWNVRMKDLSLNHPYSVTSRIQGKKCIVRIKVAADYTYERLCGELCEDYELGDLHCAVGSLPVCYFFPERIKNPRLVSPQKHDWKVSVNKDFLFIRNAFLEAGKTYKLVLEVD